MRIGHGYDIHRTTTEKSSLILGGVVFNCGFGLVAHSDGDVVFHAVADALLGAAGLGDIGRLFPDSDPAYKGLNSALILQECAKRLAAQGYTISNIDVTILAEAPKIAPQAAALAEKTAHALGLASKQVNIKAGTNEKLGPIGRGEAIAAHAVALLQN